MGQYVERHTCRKGQFKQGWRAVMYMEQFLRRRYPLGKSLEDGGEKGKVSASQAK